MSGATSLVARDRELDRALHSLRFSGGVLIAGEAGVGKTLLAATVADRLSTPPVAWLMATAASRATPLGVLSRLLPPDLATIHPALVAQHVSNRLRELSTEQRSAAPARAVAPAGARGRRRPVVGRPIGGRAVVPGHRQVGAPARHHARGQQPLRRRHRAVEGTAGRAAGSRAAGPLRVPPAAGGPGRRAGRVGHVWRCCGRAATEIPSTSASWPGSAPNTGCWSANPGCGGGPAAPRCRRDSASCCSAGSTPCPRRAGRRSTCSPWASRCRTRPSARWSARTRSWSWIATRSSPATSGAGCCCSGSPIRCCTRWPSASSARPAAAAWPGGFGTPRPSTSTSSGGPTGRTPEAVAPNVELLLAAADAVLLNDAAAALRLATRAQQAEQSVKAAVMVVFGPVRARPPRSGPRHAGGRAPAGADRG